MTVETFFTNFGYLADAPNGVQKLRELILQLAVRGKLVPQDQTDVSAEELLRNIRLSVYGKVKSGDTRKQKSEQPVSCNEQPYSLPLNWCWVRLGELAYFTGKFDS